MLIASPVSVWSPDTNWDFGRRRKDPKIVTFSRSPRNFLNRGGIGCRFPNAYQIAFCRLFSNSDEIRAFHPKFIQNSFSIHYPKV
jgi:hypothetical protein